MKGELILVNQYADYESDEPIGVQWIERSTGDDDNIEFGWEQGLSRMIDLAEQKENEARILRERRRLMNGLGEDEATRIFRCAEIINSAERAFKSTRDYLDGKRVGTYYEEQAQMGLEHWDNEARKARGLLSEADKQIAKFMGWLV